MVPRRDQHVARVPEHVVVVVAEDADGVLRLLHGTPSKETLESLMGRKRVVGACRLCGAYGPLEKSHIVSKAAYRRAAQGADGETPELGLIEITRDGVRRTTKQMKEYLLCRVCEDRFGNWERYAYPVLSQRDRVFPWLAACTTVAGQLADCSAMDVDVLARFLLSIVWRLGVYKAAKTRQESADEESTRRYLLGQTAFPAQAVLSVTLLDPSASTLGRVDRLFTNLWRGGGNGFALYQVVILGADARLFMGAGVPQDFYSVCFARTKLVRVRPSDEFAREHAGFIGGRVQSRRLSKGLGPRAQDSERSAVSVPRR
jgi:hypothetical protein